MIALFRRRYGATPLHLLGHLAAIAIAAYAVSRTLEPRSTQALSLVVWLVGGALLHDLVFLPLYLLLDQVVRLGAGDHPRRALPVANFVRVPVVMSGTMLLVYFPLILHRAPGNFVRATGVAAPDYGRRWLLITAALFAASALTYAVRAGRRRAQTPSASTTSSGPS